MTKRNVAKEVLDKFGEGAKPTIPQRNCEEAISYLWNEIEDTNSKKSLLPYIQGRKPKTSMNVTILVYNLEAMRAGYGVIK